MNATIQTTEDRALGTAVVDHALGLVAERELFTQDEALKILREARAALDNTAVSSMIDDLLHTCERDLLISRSPLLDSLLDVRNALTGDRPPAEASAQGAGAARG
jgi:hypothetical protein